MTPQLHQVPTLTRVGFAFVGLAMWALWIWMIIPAPVSAELRQRIIETSLGPSLRVFGTLILVYAIAVAGCRWQRHRRP
jgi:hypothetical protein